MAASVLNTPRAVEVGVYVVRAFIKLRELLASHAELSHKLMELESRLDLYQRLANMTKVEETDDFGKELADRFGPLPDAVKNLLYGVKVRILAAKVGVEAIQTEPNYIALKLFQGMEFYRPNFEQFLRYGILIGVNQLRVNTRRRLGEEWRGVLVEILQKMATLGVGGKL